MRLRTIFNFNKVNKLVTGIYKAFTKHQNELVPKKNKFL